MDRAEQAAACLLIWRSMPDGAHSDLLANLREAVDGQHCLERGENRRSGRSSEEGDPEAVSRLGEVVLKFVRLL